MNEKALRVRYQKNKVKKERWKMYDVIIIGAGVSGAAAARELSRYNAKVCVIEKMSAAAHPRQTVQSYMRDMMQKKVP